MAILGAYRFTVFIENLFDPGKENVGGITVHRHHHRSFADDMGDIKVERRKSKRKYEVHQGDRIGFPMFFGDESLEVSVHNPPETGYIFTTGLKAKCYPPNGLKPDVQLLPELLSGSDENGEWYAGCSWKLSKQQAGLTFVIMKYGPDPEDDDVTVGPNEPD